MDTQGLKSQPFMPDDRLMPILVIAMRYAGYAHFKFWSINFWSGNGLCGSSNRYH